MIKYGVLVEYKCAHCQITVEAKKDALVPELEKIAGASLCNHEWMEVLDGTTESGSLRTE